ncbi:MAG: potassium channel family protein, partial [Bacteroidetes bacterium]|nr:potassium channel family protein [Bacteroidota bacterium]
MGSNPALHFRYGLLTLMIIIFIGTIGYEVIEKDWGIIDSFYMTIITISTTGFKEVRPLSPMGQIFTVFLIISGVLTIAYTGGKAAQIFIEKSVFRRRRMERKLESLTDHYIVCGYGRMGRAICEGLVENELPFVVVENDPSKIERLVERGFIFVIGDATHDAILAKAGINSAKGLVAVIKTDAENVFATLSAREMNPKIYIVARAVDEGTESKLMKAGANRVVLPYELGGNRLLQLLLRPGVIDFIESVARSKDVDINLEEINVGADSILIGKALVDS